MTGPKTVSAEAIHQAGRAAAACFFAWPIREVSIRVVSGADVGRAGDCRLEIEPPPTPTHEESLQSVVYRLCGLAAEHLFDVEPNPELTSLVVAKAFEDAARAFASDRKRQTALVKAAEDLAYDVVRRYRSGIQALAMALDRLHTVRGCTAEYMLKGGYRSSLPQRRVAATDRDRTRGKS